MIIPRDGNFPHNRNTLFLQHPVIAYLAGNPRWTAAGAYSMPNDKTEKIPVDIKQFMDYGSIKKKSEPCPSVARPTLSALSSKMM